MNKTIWKFELPIEDKSEIEMPIGAEILSIQNQQETACIWALVDPDKITELRTFEVFGTGHDIYYDMGISRFYLGTVQFSCGNYVFHVFERI